MTNYIFLTNNNSEEQKYFAIEASKIETLNVSDTYSGYGQKVDAGDAGDHLELLTDKAVKIANDTYNKEHSDLEDYDEYIIKFSKGDIISAYDFRSEYDAVVEQTVEDDDYQPFKETCKGFTYWDGHNWQTITVEQENGAPSHSIVDEEDLTEELNEAITNKSFKEKGFGFDLYERGQWVITDGYYQGVWAAYEIEELAQYEARKEYQNYNY